MRTALWRRWGMGLGVAAIAAGCAADADIESDDWDESLEGEAIADIAVAGRWQPSSSVLAAGDRQNVTYDDGPAWSGGRNCAGGLLPGSRDLSAYLQRTFRGISDIDGYACRPNTANTSRLSLHGTGRAIDIFIPLSRGSADNTVGDAVAGWLIANAESIGVQYIVWDRGSWNASRPPGTKLRTYTGPHPHNDHLHVELTIAGANRRTAWFRAPAPPPPPAMPVTPPPSEPSTPSTPSTPMMTATRPSPVGINLRVTASSLNLRRGPGTSYGIVDVMSCGESARVLALPVSGWWNVEYQGATGWASSTFLQTDATFNPAVCR